MRFKNPFEKKPVRVEMHEPLLPYDVRYALQYREGKLGKEELSALARNGFDREAGYLVLKSLAATPEVHEACFREYIGALVASKPETREAFVAAVETSIAALPQDVQVMGDKLAQLSRQGCGYWHELYAACAKAHSERAHNVYLVGHATFVGLDAFVQTFRGTEKTLHVLIPQFVDDASLATCGYTVACHGEVVPLLKNFERPSHAVLIDDVRNTGASMEHLQHFWVQAPGALIPEAAYISRTTS
ncbi:MAG: hypothetical protein RLZZ234_28 [Candidatus Parcubacteria bacterium]|jgi:hypothetical protein